MVNVTVASFTFTYYIVGFLLNSAGMCEFVIIVISLELPTFDGFKRSKALFYKKHKL